MFDRHDTARRVHANHHAVEPELPRGPRIVASRCVLAGGEEQQSGNARKLLAGTSGELFVEMAGWMAMLLISGLYLWWQREGTGVWARCCRVGTSASRRSGSRSRVKRIWRPS